MKRSEFIEQLESLLCDVSVEDRQDALEYYKDYFDDAGVENEEQIISDLGSPKKVATIIRESLRSGKTSEGEYSERGYQNERFNEKEELIEGNCGEGKKTKHRNRPDVLLIIILTIFVSPILLALFAVLFAMFVGIGGVIFGFAVSGIALLLSGIAVFIGGIVMLFISPPTAMFLCGTGMILSVVGLILTILMIKVIKTFLPPLFRTIINWCRRPFHRKEMN